MHRVFEGVDRALYEALVGETLEQTLLRYERTKFCDLLWGRHFRKLADERLQEAIDLGWLRGCSDDVLGRAAHLEWLASITEQGLVLYGRRNNRCGRAESE